jgi:hypothetical protein
LPPRRFNSEQYELEALVRFGDVVSTSHVSLRDMGSFASGPRFAAKAAFRFV